MPSPHTTSRAGAFWRRWGGTLMGAAIALALAFLLWYLLSGTASTRREVASTSMLMLPPPPPPPPVPEKPPEPEPEKIKTEITEIQPTPVEPLDKPMDDKAPSPSQDLGDPVSINAPAQAGNDAFGIQSGRGGGMTGGAGGGLGSASYARYVSNMLQQALARDPRTRQLVFDDIRLDLWLATDGKTVRVQLVQGTGNTQADEAVLAMVRQLDRIDERPPASMRFPMRVSMKGRRP